MAVKHLRIPFGKPLRMCRSSDGLREKGAMKGHDRLALRRVILWPVLAVTTAVGPLNAQPADRSSQYAEADVAYGARLYGGQCTMCHGPNGDSIANVDLRSGKFRNATTDQQLNTVISNGIAG